MKIYIELSESVSRIDVHFPYNEWAVKQMRTIRGRHWNVDAKFWDVPMELDTARALREAYGDQLELGPALRAWAREQVNLERNMRSLHSASDAKLTKIPPLIEACIAGEPMPFNLPKKHALMRKRDARPYQRADIKLMAMSSAINANDVGTGKTIEAIGAVYEAGLAGGPVLVVAPRRSLVNIWKVEFERFTDYKVLTSENPAERKRMIEELLDGNMEQKLVLALIADDLRLDKYLDVKKRPRDPQEDVLHAGKDYKGNWYRFRSETQLRLYAIEWAAFIVDEFHATGLNTRTSLFHNSAKLIKSHRRWPMSGTPIGGKPRRLWPILNFIDPKQYTSEWRWIERWLELDEEKIYVKGGAQRTVKTVGDIKDPDAFFDHHKKHMTRRTKLDALPGLPRAVELLVDTPMEKKQRKEYDKFNSEHEIMLDGKRLSGAIVLAQYARLRQMANATLYWNGKRWAATDLSCKLDPLLDRLGENGIRKLDPEPGARAYVGVLDTSFLTVVIRHLEQAGIACARLDGATKDSEPIINHFEGDAEEPYVICMTVQTGGSSINLGSANSAHMLEEGWDPDVDTQFFGRGDRGSRTTPLRCYVYRTPDSIQQYVAQVAEGKKLTNNNVLDYVKEIEALRNG